MDALFSKKKSFFCCGHRIAPQIGKTFRLSGNLLCAVSVPIRGKLDSLNASVAAGVLMYAVLRAR